ncbi:hypothetical protein LDL08_40820 [Nonomuraea glycinis]|uniref:Uncharacterized protein n=1 Tax=Nonomuraea glycinis TaxID=2047744 RepID=A0A918EAW6_9ACTN|nr:hypothetical protein [Nonomuraea glycinis]MCA2182523.1 hypothetical protein [Nonomuraea glycinis]GGP17036.1 hypothetical protein GCM10012278_83280 [Nonomuraea glycinis]
MAKIKEFFRVTKTAGPHPTEVECGYQVIQADEGILLQLSTYGSDGRQSEKKTSQTLQLDRERAAELLRILTNTFPGLGEDVVRPA